MKKILMLIPMLLLGMSISAQNVVPNWFHLDSEDGYNGVSSVKTFKELLKDKKGRTVIVAVVDSGVDIEHEDLAENIWTNPGEIPDNGIDDDDNGYIDDVHGWNFIGGPDGKNVDADSYEVTRVYAKLKYKYENADPAKLNKTQKKEYELFIETKEEVESKRSAAEASIKNIEAVESKIENSIKELGKALKDQNIPFSKYMEVETNGNTAIAVAKQIITQLKGDYSSIKSTETALDFFSIAIGEDKIHFNDQLDYAYNPDFDPRSTIIMDDYKNQTEIGYGNNDVEGPDALHGTHVAGIIGAVNGNDIGMDGVARNVKIMSVRTVPNGDERDKDVANAIRYAVDNGASIINMSFGKGYSWDKKIVNDAVKYAEKYDVLLVHAAGNSAQDNDMSSNFPNDHIGKKGFLFWKKKRYADNWIEVGALSFLKGEDAIATFSNYGQDGVDLFSPGVKIFATTPNNSYKFLQGTSMASPVVAGVAAVIRSHFPSLTAEQVKSILLESGSSLDFNVNKPGSDDVVPFSTLSVSGNTVNMYNAVKLAQTVKGKKKMVNKGA